jgi:hypothetical protein
MIMSVRVTRFLDRGRSVFRGGIASLGGRVDVLLGRVVCWVVVAVWGVVGIYGRIVGVYRGGWRRGEIVCFGKVAAFCGVCLRRTVAAVGIGRVFMACGA